MKVLITTVLLYLTIASGTDVSREDPGIGKEFTSKLSDSEYKEVLQIFKNMMELTNYFYQLENDITKLERMTQIGHSIIVNLVELKKYKDKYFSDFQF